MQIAETFEKRHSDVLRDIDRSVEAICKIGERKFAESHFLKDSYKNSQNKQQPKFLLTKSGFTKIVFGYEGEKATKFQIEYIRRFEAMEAFIESLLNTKLEFPDFTDAVMLAHSEPKHYHFSNEINMIYRIVLGTDAKGFRTARGLDKGVVIKPYLTLDQIKAVENLQRADIGLIEAGLDFEQRKEKLAARYQRSMLTLSA